MSITQFLKKHPGFENAEDLRTICEPLKLLDLEYFGHVHIDKKQNLSALALLPEFFKLYFEKGYYNFDLHKASFGQEENFIIWDNVKRKKESHSMHEDFRGFNQGHTFSMVFNHEKGKDCYHFATRLGNESINGEYLHRIDFMKKFIVYFREKVQQGPLAKAYQIQLPLQIDTGGYLTDESHVNANQIEEKLQINRIYSLLGDNYLTKRELECLSWFSKGKTIEETSLILGIKARTIKGYIQSIKEKLGCVNQFQLGMYYSKSFKQF